MKKTILLFGVFLASFAFAQVSISGNSADTPEATLDVKAMKSATSPDGILIPRLTRAETLAMNGTIKEATMIYVTDNNTTAGTGTVVDVDTKGFYYFDAAATPAPGKWVKVGEKKGAVTRKVVTFAGSYTIQPDDYFFVQTGAAGTVTLPSNPALGRQICGYNKGSGTVSFTGGTMKGGNITLPVNISSCYIFDGTHWSSTTGY